MTIIESGDNFEIIEEDKERIYKVKLPELSESESRIMQQVLDTAITDLQISFERKTQAEIRKEIQTEILRRLVDFLEASGTTEIPEERKLILMADMIVSDMVGYGLLDFLLADDDLEEVMVIGFERPVYVAHRKYGMMATNIEFKNDEEIKKIIERMGRHIGRKIDAANPLLDARLPDGSRVNATLMPASLDGSTITIRKFKAETLSIIDIIKFGTMSTDLAAFIWLAVEGMRVKPANILVSGGTGSGKTTTLNCLGEFIPYDDRLISIEDTAELQLPIPHWVRLETKPPNPEGKGGVSFGQLLVNTLRMRPDRLILGEVRGEEARTLFVAMNTGHDGCMGTCHANSANETITRLINPPMSVPQIMVPALDLIVMQNRIAVGGTIKRRITEVSEIAGTEMDKVLLNKIYEFDPQQDKTVSTNVPSTFKREIASRAGISGEELNLEQQKREIVLQYMLQKDIHKAEDVNYWIQSYHKDPEATLAKIQADLGG
jgi:flagellar protein FlaI